MIVVGLTGTIASGKSTTAEMFADNGIPVFSADEAVHLLYSGRAVAPIAAAFPDAVRDGKVERQRLAAILAADPGAVARLEAIVHPLVREEEEAFRKAAAAAGCEIVVVEIPLLFETDAARRFDRIVVTTAPDDVRRARALARARMTPEVYDLLTARQLSDPEKRRRADFVVDTGAGPDAARAAVGDIIAALASSGPGTPDA
ncbi:MAG: dephospho-CoA kinase [Bauldia sp.]|nr:dephospho-CoA kinase [Bauldia sp.]MCW5718006.1 dephospho-CoA kinase [Bauldia sp.]